MHPNPLRTLLCMWVLKHACRDICSSHLYSYDLTSGPLGPCQIINYILWDSLHVANTAKLINSSELLTHNLLARRYNWEREKTQVGYYDHLLLAIL